MTRIALEDPVLRVEHLHERTIAVWTVDRPGAKNALDHATMGELLAVIAAAASDPVLRAVVLTGAGDVFVSGGDLRELRTQSTAEGAERLTDAGYALTSAIAALPVPVLAALPGPAVGGGAELAVACDMRVADERARISFKQVRMGVTTSWGTARRLAATVGAGAAARLLLTGQDLGAKDAKAMGLFDEVTPDGQALPTAIAWAEDVALGAPTAVAEMKRLLRASVEPDAASRALERRAFVATWSSPDHASAIEAYFERRAPRWSPRGPLKP